MALPTSGPLSMSAIATEQQLPTPLSNVSLRSMSATAGFVIPDAIIEFYGFQSVKAFGLSVAYFDADSACNATVTDFVRYHDGAGDLPVVNDKIYTNAAGTTLLNGGNLFFAMATLVPEFQPVLSSDYIVINTSGVVTSRVTCTLGGGGGPI